MRQPDVIIVGGGVIGAAIFHEMAGACAAMLVDRARVAQGCTAWSGGIVRCFHDDPTLSDRAVVGLHYYRQFKARTGIDIPLVQTGFIFVAKPARADWSRQEVARLAGRIAIEWLDQDEMRRRFGDIVAEPVPAGIYESEAGYMDAAAVARAWLRAGQLRGGRIFEGTEVHGLLKDGNRVVGVQTNVGPLFADKVVLATGPQSPALLDRLSFAHRLYRQDIQVDLRMPTPPVARHPAFIDEELQLNGRGDVGSGGIYLGFPTNRRGEPDRSDLDLAHSVLIQNVGKRRFRWVATSGLQGGVRSADCYSEDAHGCVTALSDTERTVFLATGFSGGGFKMAPWIAAEVKRLIRQEPATPAQGA